MMSLVSFCLVIFVQVAGAYEYPLQFTPKPGYRGLLVAGYRFEGNEVVGNCSYYTVSANSGKGSGGHASTPNRYEQTCRWDLYGNLLSVKPGAPAVPAPMYVKGTQTVYAVNANGGYTGTDTKLPERGFVNTLSPHYTWLTSNDSAVLQQTVSTHVVTLKSDGDAPVDITAVEASALKGTAEVQGTTCRLPLEVGATCSITVTYDPTKLISPTGLAYDTLHIGLTSNAGRAHDFLQKYTIAVRQELD